LVVWWRKFYSVSVKKTCWITGRVAYSDICKAHFTKLPGMAM